MKDDQQNNTSPEIENSTQEELENEEDFLKESNDDEDFLKEDHDEDIIEADESQLEYPSELAEETTSGQEGSQAPWQERLNQVSMVASSPNQKKFMLVGLLAVTAIILYYIFWGRTPTPAEIKKQEAQQISETKQKVVESSVPVTAPSLPDQGQSPGDSLSPSVSAPSAPQQIEAPAPPPAPVAPTPSAPAAVFTENSSDSSNDNTPSTPAPAPAPTPSSPPSAPETNQALSSYSSLLQTNSEKQAAAEAALQKKRGSKIIIFGGSSGSSSFSGSSSSSSKSDKSSSSTSSSNSSNKNNAKSSKSSSGFLGFGNGTFNNNQVSKTSSKQVDATDAGKPDNMIFEGKMIDAVLETAINTDLPGSLRAVISRDVYAESGYRILIPKGSRAIGTYDNQVADGQTRVKITWHRIIRPDGIDIGIESEGTDGLGRAGIVGKFNNRLWKKLGAALLISYIVPNLANKMAGTANQNFSQSSTASNGVVTSVTSGTAQSVSASGAADKFSNLAENAINSSFPQQPTLTVNQGTKINIMTQADLIFPPESVLAQQKVLQ